MVSDVPGAIDRRWSNHYRVDALAGDSVSANTEQGDIELLARIAAGDEEAFIALYRLRRHEIYRYAYSMVRSVSLAQDVTQEVFLKILERSANFNPSRGSVRAWLYGCARIVVLNRFRQERRYKHEVHEQSVDCNGAEEVQRRQQLDILHMAIMSLPVEYRDALVLFELAELSYSECATVMGCAVGTVRSRLHRARALVAARVRSHDITAAGPGHSAEIAASEGSC